MIKQAKKKKRNPQDLTVKNRRRIMDKIASLTKRMEKLEDVVQRLRLCEWCS